MVEDLVNIWEHIPKLDTDQVNLSQEEVLQKHLDVLGLGETFYIFFHTKTTVMEKIHSNLEKILGYKTSEFSLNLLLSLIHPDDLPYFAHYEQSAVKFFSQLPPEQISKYKFSYDYRIKTKDGTYKRFVQQTIPLYYDPEGGARTLSIFTDVSHFHLKDTPKLSFIGMQDAPSFYNIHLQEEYRLPQPKLFTSKELEILKYIVKGEKTEGIAQLLNRSVFTINNHRKNILRKAGCSSVQELCLKAVNQGWVNQNE
jgi:DNA-binding CsgD family transcriptional regulator